MKSKGFYIFKWAQANTLGNPWTSLTAMTTIAVATFIAASLLGFVDGYQKAVKEDVNRLGYDLLITAKGCPYEAATLMLRGGVGLQYMPEGVVSKLEKESDVTATFPMLIHPIKNPGENGGIVLVKGVASGWFDSLHLTLKEGKWFEETATGLNGEGVVLGYEAAELETRHAGDPYLLYESKTKTYRETKVLGILKRTGTQVDGTVLLPLIRVQEDFDLEGKLTGVGVRIRESNPEKVALIREQYNLEPKLQVVSLSKIESTLRKALANMKDVIQVLSWILALMAGAVLLNTTLIRTLGEQRKLATLQLCGVPSGFIAAVAIAENMLLSMGGIGLGLLSAAVLRSVSVSALLNYVPYTPSGDLLALSGSLVASFFAFGVVLALVATLPPLVRLRKMNHPQTLWEG